MLFTIPGQGSPINTYLFKRLLTKKRSQVSSYTHLLPYILDNPSNPGSISVASHLLFNIYKNENDIQYNKQNYLLGHSLGELTCLAINDIFNIDDLFNIANYRNDLMIEYSKKYILENSITSNFQMWAITAPRADDLSKSLYFSNLLKGTIYIANINSSKQCVMTGTNDDFNKYLLPSLKTVIGNAKITKLLNPDNIPFHNNNILKPLSKQLYEYTYEKIRKNNNNNMDKLKFPIISNYDASISYLIDDAITKFVNSSVNTVQFYKSCETFNNLDKKIDNNIVCIGPTNAIFKQVKRNCRNATTIIDFSFLDDK